MSTGEVVRGASLSEKENYFEHFKRNFFVLLQLFFFPLPFPHNQSAVSRKRFQDFHVPLATDLEVQARDARATSRRNRAQVRRFRDSAKQQDLILLSEVHIGEAAIVARPLVG